MRTGVVAMVDALGWKGIWRRKDPDSILKQQHEIEEVINSMLKGLRRGFEEQGSKPEIKDDPRVRPFMKSMEVDVRFLSDTIVAAFFHEGDIGDYPPAVGQVAVEAATVLIRVAITAFAFAETPVLYRGAVTAGRLDISGNSLIGPAIDQAAELMDVADGAFVWLDPASGIEGSELAWIERALPLRSGQVLQAQVLNPLIGLDEEKVTKFMENAERSFGERPSLPVLVKKQHTMAFLKDAAEHAKTVSKDPVFVPAVKAVSRD